MKILVLGAAGRTGKLVVAEVLKAGHQVAAVLHSPGESPLPAEVEVTHGDARNPATLERLLQGRDAVIDAIGGTTPYLDKGLESGTAEVVVAAMRRLGVPRLIVISAMGVGDSVAQSGFFYEHLLMPTFLRGAVADKARMEHAVETSGLQFVIVRPPILSDADATGDVHVVEADDKAHSLTRGDLARFLVEQLTGDTYLGRHVVVANR